MYAPALFVNFQTFVDLFVVNLGNLDIKIVSILRYLTASSVIFIARECYLRVVFRMRSVRIQILTLKKKSTQISDVVNNFAGIEIVWKN